jgi:hypothetical protein
MSLEGYLNELFDQLRDLLDKITGQQYTRPATSLFGASVGEHVRHILEGFQCLENGYESGIVNYEKRERNKRIQTDKEFARELMHIISRTINQPNKKLSLEASYDLVSNNTLIVHTNYYREIIYNLEHTVHHMALIRVGITEVASIKLPAEFGVAPSTIRHRKTGLKN